jgi:hypothetical protein
MFHVFGFPVGISSKSLVRLGLAWIMADENLILVFLNLDWKVREQGSEWVE